MAEEMGHVKLGYFEVPTHEQFMWQRTKDG